MPTYDIRCDGCGFVDEVLCRVSEKDTWSCPDCLTPMHTYLKRGPALVGAMWDKKVRIGGADKVFETNAELRAYEAQCEAEGFHIVSTSDSRWKAVHDQANNDGERAAQKAGFRNHDEFSVAAKRAVQTGVSMYK